MTSHSRTHADENPDSDAVLPDKIRRGRVSRWRFTQTPQWVLLMSELSDAGYRVYSLLLAHANVLDDDGEVWPQQQTLADMLDKHRNSISRVITKELEPLGLADIEVERYGTNNTRRRNIYIVHEFPPDGFTGWASIAEWYKAHPRPEPAPTNRRERKTAGQAGRTKNGASGRTTDGASGRTENSAVTRGRGNEMKGEASSSPTPPSTDTLPPLRIGTEDETSKSNNSEAPADHTPYMERAQTLLDSAVCLWADRHKAPTGRSRQRLSERIAAEIAAGGDETVIVHELSRDMSDIGNAVSVMVKDRTVIPGWGQAHDPRPAHSQHEIKTRTPWCGGSACDERTRLANVYDPQTGETKPARCRTPIQDPLTGETVACHPRATPRLPQPAPIEDEGQAPEDLGPEVLRQMEADLEAKAAQARERKKRELAATKALFSKVRSGAAKEEAARGLTR